MDIDTPEQDVNPNDLELYERIGGTTQEELRPGRNRLTSSVMKRQVEILSTGQFSDVEVIVGEQNLRLHKAIICTESEVFQKAFTCGTKESEDSTLTIDEEDEEAFLRLIVWMYTKRLSIRVDGFADLELHDLPTDDMVRTLVRVCVLGAKYLVSDDLEKSVVDVIKEILADEGEYECMSDDFIEMAPMLYSRPPWVHCHLKRCMVEYFCSELGILREESHFVSLLEQVPVLSTDILLSPCLAASASRKPTGRKRLRTR